MHLDSTLQQALKAYLIRELSPLCDADPAVLADYVIALLKHDKSTRELQDLCTSQLEDFLRDDTTQFVKSLFAALESKSYLEGTSSSYLSGTSGGSPAPPSQLPGHKNSTTSQTSQSSREDRVGGGAGLSTGKHRRASSDVSDDDGDRNFKHARRDDRRDSLQSLNSYRHVNQQLQQSQQSSFKPPHQQLSQSDDRRLSNNNNNNNNSKSYGSGQHQESGDRFDNRLPVRRPDDSRNSWQANQHQQQQQGGGPNAYTPRGPSNGGMNTGINGPRQGGGRNEWNGPPQQQQLQRNNGPPFVGPSSNGPMSGLNGSNSDWQGGGRGGPQTGNGGFVRTRSRQPCRDFEEQGFCMRGDSCMFSHGDAPIVVDPNAPVPFDLMGGANAGPLAGSAGGPMGRGGSSGFLGNPQGMMPNGPGMHGPVGPMGISTGRNLVNNDEFDQDSTGFGQSMSDRSRQQQQGFDNTNSQFGNGSMDGSSTRGGHAPRGRGSTRGARGVRGGRGSHPYAGGPGGRFSGGGGGSRSNNTLVVENIPDEFNTIVKVNEFFQQFGILTNIQVDQPAHKALIQYGSREEASSAYNSPDVIFGNRFVKVYWQPEEQTVASPQQGGGSRGVSSGGAGVGPSNRSSLGGPTGLVAAGGPNASGHISTAPSVMMTPERAKEIAAERAAQQAKQQENLKMMQDIQKQKDDLIQRQQEVQAEMLQKVLTNKTMSQIDRDLILQGLKKVAIEVTKEPVNLIQVQRDAAEAAKQAAIAKQAEKLEKDRLDRELEVLNKVPSAAGATAPSTLTPMSSTSTAATTAAAADGTSATSTSTSNAGLSAAETSAALKAKLAALQAEAAALGVDGSSLGLSSNNAGRGGRGGFLPRGGRGVPRGGVATTWTRGSGRGGAPVSQHRTFKLDNRVPKVSIQNLEGKVTKADLESHLVQNFGEVESVELSADNHSAIVQFKFRKDAESAIVKSIPINEAPSMITSWVHSHETFTTAAASFAGARAGAAPKLASATPILSATPPLATASPVISMAAGNGTPSDSTSEAVFHEDSDDDKDKSWKR